MSDAQNRQSNESEVERLIREDKAYKDLENKALKKKEEKKSVVKPVLLISGGLALTLAGLLVFKPFSSEEPKEETPITTAPTVNQEPTKTPEPVSPSDPEAFFKTEGNMYPIEKESALLKPMSFSDEQYSALVKSYGETQLFAINSIYPSELQGFTSNEEEKQTDGALSPFYVYMTKELYEKSIVNALEVMINPEYGEWRELQWPDYTDVENETLKKLLTKKAYNTYVKKPSKGPLFIDLEKNNYGEDNLLDETSRWIGHATEINHEFSSKTDASIITAKVEYTAWTKNKKKLVRDATLSFKVSLKEGASSSHEKIKISGIKLVFDESK